MERHQLIRSDFPSGNEGFDRDSVGAHLVAVAAHVAALEARIVALEVERDILRRQLDEAGEASATQAVTAAPAAEHLPPTPESVSAADGPVAPESEPDPAPVARASSEEPVNAAEVPARLLASKLAMEGVDRETIRSRLDAEYDLEDADSLLDDVIERLS